jgi:hypothetical protein
LWGLKFLENVFPPIPSELIMPLAGFLTIQGQLSLIAIVLPSPAFPKADGSVFVRVKIEWNW